MAKFHIWLFLIALSASQIRSDHSFSNRNRRQHSSQQNLQLSSPFYNTYIYDEIHTKQQADLARIQQFLVRNNVTLGVNSQYFETGSWSEWSQPTECSRKCGGGVVLQARHCLNDQCLGPSKKFYSCNTEDCDPDEPDFREKQCSDFDTQPFKGRYFSWIPYLQAQNPCELNCMPKGERFYYRHLEKVVDGTKCFNDGSLDVCVDGQCMPVGCDNQLGSAKKADRCGVCGGDSTSCHTVQGVYENDNLRTGYNDLITIPAGARNIKIEEIAGTSNYLAIRSIKGNYYLNGNWKIEFPRSLKFAGTVFNYVRESNAHDSAESLSSSGPINEPLMVVILYQERNRGIKYEYSIKKNDTSLQNSYDQIITGNEIDRMDRYPDRYADRYADRQPERHPDRYYGSQYQNYRTQIMYRWWSGDFTPCSRHCSGGQQQRRVVCLKLQAAQAANMSSQELPANSEVVQDQYCDSRRKPANIQNCNTHVCPPIWQVGHWSKCICDSKVNETRIKIRSVFCKKGAIHPDTGRPISDVWVTANDDECDEVRGIARRPASIRPCDDENEECVNATLALAANVTAAATETTGEAKNETEPLSDKKTLDLDDLLNELATAPALRKCQITYAYKWNVGDWAKCDSRCGEGKQKRNVTCVEIDPTTGRLVNENRALQDLYCRHESRPESERKCDDVPCQGVDWVVSDWSKCVTQDAETATGDSTSEASVDVKPSGHLKNQTKLSSIQTRTAACSTRFGRIYADNLCGLGRKPETRRKCEKKQEVAQWFASEWSSCSAVECGNGFRTRAVHCAVGDGESIRVVDEKDCNENVKPVGEESCTGKQAVCDELILVSQAWTSCVDKCEQTRSLICLAKNQTTNLVEPVSCDDKTGGFEVKRKCESDSVDAQTECNPNELDKNCTATEFGCCPFSDGETAEGPNFKGCSPKLNEECEKSEFGCCQHSASEASGPFQLGCVLNCNLTRFGCCIDNVTTAINAELSNCLPLCYSMEFGCCKDNSTAIDTEKSNCPENAKKPAEKPVTEDEICEEEVLEGSGDEVVEGSGGPNSSDQIDVKPAKVCKKKTVAVACKDTKFGCCDDQVTIKLDENGLGCNVTSADLNCEANPNQEGCRSSVLPADCDTNPDQERCKAPSAELNCAKNPNQEGCRASAPSPDSCQLSEFKCCFDNKTPARGILENGKPDCPCEATEFGCCPDDKSVAHGPKFEGCDCRSSPHGCCSDGSVALGPRFIGCPDGPGLDLQYSAPVCSLPRERGSCRNFTVQWFFDREYGGCSRFWYGGCEGNGNRFQSLDECEGICMKPKGSDACALPLVKGACDHEKLYWGYNNQKHVCEQFKYGGCLGNLNRFETRESCESTCYYSEYNDPCEQPLLPGQCAPDQIASPQPRYYFNKFTSRCEAFIYSNCNGNKNNFVTIEECQNRCGARTAREICVLPVSPGTCLGKFPRYYFDYKTGVCREFTYSGCGSNNNRFVDKESCERLCNSTYNPAYGNEINSGLPQPSFTIPVSEQDKKSSDISATLATLQYICNNNKDPGNCDGSFMKWYFNPVERKCQQFVYSGCSSGNPNRFDTRPECEARCVHQLSAYIRLQQEQLLRQQYKIIEEQNQQRRNQLEKQVTQKQNACLQPRETGNCYNFQPRFYYDPDDKGCHKFYYSGCNGNENNFVTFEECTQRCGTPLLATGNNDLSRNRVTANEPESPHTFRTEDCFLPKERGPCDNDEPKWYYDSQDGVCKQFYYSSCGGNNNRFNDGRECQKRCWNSQEICRLPKVRGPCNGNFSQWYYDSTVKDCLEFSYSGCQSNANRFSSKEMCLEACSSQSQINYPSSILMEHMQNKKASDICHLKPEKGEGREYVERYYFDLVQGMCKMFIYSGQGGNANNFERRDQCERQCADGHKLEHPEPTDLNKRQEICLMPSDKGLCSQKFARWFYDPSSFTCSSMIYSGCGGNLNKFLTFDNCMNFCAGVKAKINEEDQSSNNLLPTTTQQPTPAPFSPIYLQPTPPPMPSLEERPAKPEECPVENCNQRCSFGVDTYTDSKGCTRCRCAHPCNVHSCPSGQRCAVEVYRTETGQALVQPICRLIRKPGECPLSVVLSQLKASCNSTCRIDADCRGTDKCCNNGCANVCVGVQTTREENSDESEKLSLKVRLNDQAVLNCGLIPAQTEVSVAWNKDGRPVLQSVAAQQNRIQLLTNGSLLIIMTRPEDQGEYTCSYAKRETSELVTKRRIIEVYDPVSILPGPRQVIATLNQPAILSCNARGIPAPLVTWWKDKRILPTQSSKYSQNPENYQLRINSVTNADAGLYYCQAHNDHGQIRVYDVTLLLEFEPNLRVPKIPELNDNSIYQPTRTNPIQQQSILGGGGGAQPTDSLSQVYVRQGQIVQGPNRQFSLDGRPIPSAEPLSVKTRLANEEYKTGSSLKIDCLTNQNSNITWYFNNEPIESSNHLASLARRDPKYAVVKNADNSISIDTLIRQHSGVYKCKGSNEASYAASDLTIEVEDIPLPAKCRDSNAYLNCAVIVNFRYCSNRTYFTYCCKSCVLSKQISIEEVYRRLT